MNDQGTMMNQQQQQHRSMNTNQNLMSMNQINPHQQQPQMVPISRSYGMWPPLQQFPNPNPNAKPNTGGQIKPPPSFNKSLGPKNNWKGKKVNRPVGNRRKDQQNSMKSGGINMNTSAGGLGNLSYNSYQPPPLNELQHQNKLKTRNFYPKKKFNKNYSMNMNMGNTNYYKNSRSAPYAPRNTSSFLIRAKKSGGIASLVSPCPVTPSILPTPIFSPTSEVLVDMAKEEWGVDGYGSMKGLIRLRSPGHEMEPHEDDEEEEGTSSESDVEEHVEVERRLDHDLSRFEMIYDPNNSVNAGGMEYHNVLENRVDDQDSHIAQLEEENLLLKEKLFLMERELGDLRRRMQCLERREKRDVDINEEVVENESENDSESGGEGGDSVEDNDGEFCEDNVQVDGYECSKDNSDDVNNAKGNEAGAMMDKNLVFNAEWKDGNDDNVVDKNNILDVEDNEENNNNEFIEANETQRISILM